MLPDIKFCPFCGRQTLFETEHVKCHGCGEEFNVLTPEDLQELQTTYVAHQECIEPAEVNKLIALQDAVAEFLDGDGDRLAVAYDATI